MSAVPPATPVNRSTPADTRVYRMRIARGACWVIVAALLGVVLLAVLDYFVLLPSLVRGLGLALWLTGTGVVAWRLVVRRLPPDSIDDPTPHPREELPGNLKAAAAAAISLSAALVFATLIPGAWEHLRRVAMPWSRPSAARYIVTVSSGEAVVRRGDAVTLTAYADKIDPSAATPDTATLFGREMNGKVWKLPMVGNGRGAFYATRPDVNEDFEYRVQIGTATSEWFSVLAIDPAEPAAESSIEVRPPQYATSSSTRVFPGFVSFEGFQHGTAEIRLRFTRPATTAFLEWRPDGGGAVELTSLDLVSGNTTFRLSQNGSLKLATVVERNGKALRTEVPVEVRVLPDGPPRFERMMGVSSRVRAARPGSTLPIEFAAADDIAVGTAVLEYAIGSNDSQVMAIPIPLSAAGTPLAEGRIDFNLTNKGQVGDTIRFRLMVADTRRLDEPELKPQETRYPATGWSVIRLDPAATPLDEQDFLAQRNAIHEAARLALDEINEARKDAGSLQRDTIDSASLAPQHAVRLNDIADRVRKVVGLLKENAREATLTPDLRPLAARIRVVADEPLKSADDSLRRSATDNLTVRTASLTAAINSLNDSAIRLDQLIVENHRLAGSRLDRKRIDLLARNQAELASQAKPGGISPQELARLQSELIERLQALVAESDSLRAAADEARQKEFRRLSMAAGELATMLRDLDMASRQVNADARREELEAIATDQGKLVAQASALLAKIETAARLAGIGPPRLNQFTRVSNLIVAGRTVDALTELLALAQGLDSVADTFEKWTLDRADPKVAARQLALWQDDIRTRFRAATSGKSSTFDELPDAKKKAIRSEQSALQATVVALNLPSSSEVASPRDLALLHLNATANFLAGSGANADEAMKFSSDALNRLAEKVPNTPERLTRTRAGFAKLQQAQDSILVEIEQIARGTASINKLAALAERQRKQITAFAALDLPGLEVRCTRIAASLEAASADLKNGLLLDATASQQWVKREFERLKLVFDGYSAPDDKIEELALKLNAIARAVEALGLAPTARQLAPHSAEVKEVSRQFSQVAHTPEAPSLRSDALETVLAAEAALGDNQLKPIEVVRRLRVAADAFAELSNRLNGRESDLDRVRRLASNRRAIVASEEARKREKRDPDPTATGVVSRQLSRDAEELALTRVGFAGQALKKRLLDQYARLKDQQFPDRLVGIHKGLAESLDELAALMADIEELTATYVRPLQAAPSTEADTFLPSKLHAQSIRDLSRQQRALHDRITGLAAAVQLLVKPAENNPLAELNKQQRELAAAITLFAQKLDLDHANSALGAAAEATHASEWLANGLLLPARGSAEKTAQSLRNLAQSGETKTWSMPAAELAARQEAIIAVLKQLSNAPGIAAAQQKGRGEDLARKAIELGLQLEFAAQNPGPDESATKALRDAAASMKTAGNLIAEATWKATSGMTTDAEKVRAAALVTLKKTSDKIVAQLSMMPVAAATDQATANSAENLRRAETTMRKVLGQLDARTDWAEIEKTMRTASDALSVAAKTRLAMVERK